LEKGDAAGGAGGDKGKKMMMRIRMF